MALDEAGGFETGDSEASCAAWYWLVVVDVAPRELRRDEYKAQRQRLPVEGRRDGLDAAVMQVVA